MRAILSIIAISVGFLYVIIDFVNQVKGGIPFYLTIALGGIISIYLNIKGRFFASSVVLLSAINGVVFLFAEGDSQRVGTYMFFICTCITAFSLFGYENIIAALTFSMLSLTLYVLGYWFEFDFVSERILPEDKIMHYVSLNVITALVTSVFIVFFLLQIN